MEVLLLPRVRGRVGLRVVWVVPRGVVAPTKTKGRNARSCLKVRPVRGVRAHQSLLLAEEKTPGPNYAWVRVGGFTVILTMRTHLRTFRRRAPLRLRRRGARQGARQGARR